MGFSEGFNPFRSSDATISAKSAEMPVLRIAVPGIASGEADPGGRAWIWLPAALVTAGVVVVVLRR
jgi:hypothetical protein